MNNLFDSPFENLFFKWIFPIVVTISVIVLFFTWFVYPLVETNNLNKFCEEHNYDNGQFGNTISQKSYCIKYQEGNVIIKTEVDLCKEGWCIVKNEN